MDVQKKEAIKDIVGREQERSNRHSFWRKVYDMVRMPFTVRREGESQRVQFVRPDPFATKQTYRPKGFNQGLTDVSDRYAESIYTLDHAVTSERLVRYMNIEDMIDTSGYVGKAYAGFVSEVSTGGAVKQGSAFMIDSDDAERTQALKDIVDKLELDTPEFMATIVEDIIKYGVCMYRYIIDYKNNVLTGIERVDPYTIESVVYAKFSARANRYEYSSTGSFGGELDIDVLNQMLDAINSSDNPKTAKQVTLGYIVANRSLKDQVSAYDEIVKDPENRGMSVSTQTEELSKIPLEYSFYPIWELAQVMHRQAEKSPLGIPYFSSILPLHKRFNVQNEIALLDTIGSMPREIIKINTDTRGMGVQETQRVVQNLLNLFNQLNTNSQEHNLSLVSKPTITTNDFTYEVISPAKKVENVASLKESKDEFISALLVPWLTASSEEGEQSGNAITKRSLLFHQEVTLLKGYNLKMSSQIMRMALYLSPNYNPLAT